MKILIFVNESDKEEKCVFNVILLIITCTHIKGHINTFTDQDILQVPSGNNFYYAA